MKSLRSGFSLSLILAISILFGSCAKQQPDQPPGTAIITNLKTDIHIAQTVTTSTKDALPALMKNADAEDVATATGIVNDVNNALGILDKKIAPYTSFNASNQQAIKQAAQDFLDALRQMQATGVTHIKNPALQARVRLGLDLALGALSLWQPAA